MNALRRMGASATSVGEFVEKVHLDIVLMGPFEKHKYLIANHKSQIFAICDLVLNPFKNP